MTETEAAAPIPDMKPSPATNPPGPATNNGTPNAPTSTNKKRKGKGGGGGGGGGGPGPDDTCRDFLNGICARGNRCRFRHPENESTQNGQNTPYTFCIDFQNRGCYRESCRFVHATAEDAERYQSKGFVSLPLARAIAATLTINDSINGIPICKEFQTGACSRGNNRCRYWHVVVEDERLARHNMVMHGGGAPPMGGRGGPPHPAPLGIPHYTPGMRRGAPPMDYDYEPVPAKRAFRMPPPPGMGNGSDPRSYVASIEHRNADLEKEVDTLRRELDREKHRYEDLMALFKQSQAHAPVPPAPVPMGGHGPQYNWHHEGHGAGWN